MQRYSAASFLLLLCATASARGDDPCASHPCTRGVCLPTRSALTDYTCMCPVGWAGVRCEVQALVAPAFSSNMVLQRGPAKRAVLFGGANATVAGDEVTLIVSGGGGGGGGGVSPSSFRAAAGADGSWRMVLPPLNATLAPLTLRFASARTNASCELRNVLVGDVYVCAGQSNMALAVGGAALPSTPAAVEEAARRYGATLRLLNNGHFWPPTPSRPGETALGAQTGDAPGWSELSFGSGSTASPGTVANFSAACWFMGTALADAAGMSGVPVGLISTAAGGTSIHRWSSASAAARCDQVTPTSPDGAQGLDIGTLFRPMVLPLAPMAVAGFAWFQGESNECPTVQGWPCGGSYLACQLRAMIEDWRRAFDAGAGANATGAGPLPPTPFIVNELGAHRDGNWPLLRQAFHEALGGLEGSAVISNSDLGSNNAAMHSQRKAELGRRMALAMGALTAAASRAGGGRGASSASAATAAAAAEAAAPLPGAWAGPTLRTASILPEPGQPGALRVTVGFEPATAATLHLAGAAECSLCCGSDAGSPLMLRVANASDITGFTWQRTAMPTVGGDGASLVATFALPAGGVGMAGGGGAVDTSLLQFQYEGAPQCVLYNGAGGPDNHTGIAAYPWRVNISTGAPVLVPAPPCQTMARNGSCVHTGNWPSDASL